MNLLERIKQFEDDTKCNLVAITIPQDIFFQVCMVAQVNPNCVYLKINNTLVINGRFESNHVNPVPGFTS